MATMKRDGSDATSRSRRLAENSSPGSLSELREEPLRSLRDHFLAFFVSFGGEPLSDYRGGPVARLATMGGAIWMRDETARMVELVMKGRHVPADYDAFWAELENCERLLDQIFATGG